VTPDFGNAARRLLAGEPDDSSDQVAERAARAFERFTTHLASLLSQTGTQLLLRRSVMITTSQFPWLAVASTPADTISALRMAMQQQGREATQEAFVALLGTFVALLERLIGEGLVARQLDDVWPTVFTDPAKDTP